MVKRVIYGSCRGGTWNRQSCSDIQMYAKGHPTSKER
jgi:hypothetical protein